MRAFTCLLYCSIQLQHPLEIETHEDFPRRPRWSGPPPCWRSPSPWPWRAARRRQARRRRGTAPGSRQGRQAGREQGRGRAGGSGARSAKRPISASYAGTASLEAPGEAQVVAKTSGVVLQMLVEEGDQVQAGQVLARIDPDRPRLEMERARATMRKLENNYRRSQELLASKLVSAEASDQIRYDLEAAARQLRHRPARTVLHQHRRAHQRRDRPAHDQARQPGRSSTRRCSASSTSRGSRPCSTCPSASWPRSRPACRCACWWTRSRARPSRAAIDRVSPVVDVGSGTFRVVSAFEGGGMLRPGMFGRIDIVYDQRTDALIVPRVALLDDDGETGGVRRARQEGRAHAGEAGLHQRRTGRGARGPEGRRQVVTAGKVAIRDGTDGGGDQPGRPAAGGRRWPTVAALAVQMSLVEFSTRRRVTIAMVTITLVLFGADRTVRPQGQPAAGPELSRR